VVGAVAAVIAIIGLKRIQTLNQNLTQTVEFLSTNVQLASLLKQDLITVTRAEKNMLLAQSEDAATRFAGIIDDVLSVMEKRISQLRELLDERDRQLLEQFSQKWAGWRKNHGEIRSVTTMNPNVQARSISVGEAQVAVDRLASGLDAISEQSHSELTSSKIDGDSHAAAIAVRKMNLAAAALRIALQMQRIEKDLLLAQTEADMRRYEADFEPLKNGLEGNLRQLDELVHGSEQQIAVAAVKQACDAYLEANARIRSVAGNNVNYVSYHLYYEIGNPIANECEELLTKLIDSNEQTMEQYRRSSEQAYVASRSTLLGISIFGIFFSVMISFYAGHRIAHRLSVLSQYAATIQNARDLSRPIPQLGSDEVGLLAESIDQMRESLRRHTVSLSEQADRLAELTESLEAKNQEMEQFVYTVSHDLKSPLVSCKGLLGLLKEDVADRDYDAVVDSAKRLDEATDQLNLIIDDLLMLSRIGRKSLELEEVDVGGLVKEVANELSDRIEATHCKVEIAESMPAIMADKSDVRRVFVNLLTNALKYGCGQQGARVTIGGASHGHEVRYFVRDYGPGIDRKYHDRIFGLFQRLETSVPGTGLGLASVARIMTMHGGRAWVESELGQGATFWIAFPRVPQRLKR
jgi:signal transduction histidine kinase